MNSQNIFKFQELVRIIDATLGEVNPSGLPTGQNSLSIIKFISSFNGMDQFLPSDFRDKIKEELNKTNEKENVREHVKKILTYPKTGYSPWTEQEFDQDLLDQIKLKCENVKFKIQLVEGKVYGLCISPGDKVNDIVFNELKDKLLKGLRLNFETSHITIVNSNVVADIGIDKVISFIKNFDQEFCVETGKIKSTFSEDWSRFSECYVVELECEYIDNFIEKFNKEFNKTIKITKHSTFAIKPRSLWV